MNSKALLVATALFLAMSAVSCGKDDSTESDVSISLSEQQTATKNTSAETTADKPETTATTDSAETTTATTDESGTTTGTDTTTETSAEVTTDTTSAETAGTAVPQAEATTPTEANEQQPENPAPTEAPPADTQPPETEPPTEAPTQSEPVKFKMEDLLSDASGIIANLGTPSYSGGGAACLTNGHDDKIYQYDGLEIQCYIDGDVEYIFQINITGGDYQTDKGIKVGSTRAEVESAYGTGTESGNMIVYSSGNNEMDIQYNGDTVASIFFYTPV